MEFEINGVKKRPKILFDVKVNASHPQWQKTESTPGIQQVKITLNSMVFCSLMTTVSIKNRKLYLLLSPHERRGKQKLVFPQHQRQVLKAANTIFSTSKPQHSSFWCARNQLMIPLKLVPAHPRPFLGCVSSAFYLFQAVSVHDFLKWVSTVYYRNIEVKKGNADSITQSILLTGQDFVHIIQFRMFCTVQLEKYWAITF